MASHYVSIDRGDPIIREDSFAYTTSSTAGAELEVRVLDGVSWKRSELSIYLAAIADRIINNQSTPDADAKSVDAFL